MTKYKAGEDIVAEIEVSCDDGEEPGERHHCQKPFICSQCGRRFTRNGYQQTHLRTHTGEKQFRYSMCGKGFTRNSHVEQHKAVHKEEEHLSRVWNRTMGWTSAGVSSSFQLHPTSSADKPTIHPEFCFSGPLKNKGGAKADQNPLRVQADVTGHNANIPKKRTKKVKMDLTGEDVRSRRKELHCSECEKMFAFQSCLKRHMRSHAG
ncbi:zinc finger protein 224-like [Sphaeramia orbicularis]|uniref:zinc finger protein 224-like n=1 Tax=Sphaeramia orbicularis TaxID=375764 RepID=UPI00117C770D|nr:zinc finger protein 224-like [Sphaeramia orbicularis]